MATKRKKRVFTEHEIKTRRSEAAKKAAATRRENHEVAVMAAAFKTNTKKDWEDYLAKKEVPTLQRVPHTTIERRAMVRRYGLHHLSAIYLMMSTTTFSWSDLADMHGLSLRELYTLWYSP